jgi:hypothetical protein
LARWLEDIFQVAEPEVDTRNIKIGDLLCQVGILTSGDLTEAIQIAKRMGVPIGRVLVMSGCVSETTLQASLEAQSMVRDNLVDLDTALKAMDIVNKQKKSFKEALDSCNWTPRKASAGNKLGDLLIDSSIVTPQQLERALESSFQSGMPLGGTLVLQGVLSAQLLPTLLHVQEKVRDDKMTRDEAVEQIKTAVMYWAKATSKSEAEELASAKQAQSEMAPPAAGTASTSSVKGGAKPAARPQPTQPIAADLPTHVGWIPLRNATAGSDSEVSLIQLLKLSGYCSPEAMEQAVDRIFTDSQVAAQLLQSIGFIDAPTLNVYTTCQSLISRGVLKVDQAIYVLNSVRYRSISLENALAELGVTGVTQT